VNSHIRVELEFHPREKCPYSVLLPLNSDSSPVQIDPAEWFVCFASGIDKHW